MGRRRTDEDRAAQARFGAALRLLRASAGLGLRELARRVGVSATYVSRVESGAEPPPSAERLVGVARAIGVAPDVLEELAGRVAPDLVDYLHARPAAVQLLRALQRVEATDEDIHALTRQVPARATDDGGAWLADVLGHALASDAAGDPCEALAAELAPLGADPAALVLAMRARGEVSEVSRGRRVGLLHAEAPGLATTVVVLVRSPGPRPRLALGVAYPGAEAARRVAVLGALARLASDGPAIAALVRAAPRALTRALRRELRRVVGVDRDGRRPAA